MRFYYISIISVLLLIVIWVVGTGLLAWFGSRLRKTRKRIWPVMVPLFLILYIGPIAEELWIARSFEQLCTKDAGIFIYKTVEVEGFYDDTGAALSVLRDGGYAWMEGPSRSGKGASRLTRGDGKFTQAAIERFNAEHAGKKAGERGYIRVEFGESIEALVFPKKDESWRIQRLDHPTARYHYKWPEMNSSVSYKVRKTERLVSDSESGEVLGRYVDYDRTAPWFFVGLDKPLMFCKEAEADARERGTVFGPRMVLRPLR